LPAKKQMQHIYVGVDLHKQHHTAVIIDCWTEKLGEIRFENKPAAYPELLAEVNRHLSKGMTPIYGLEDTGGYGRGLAVFLQEQGQIVKEVNTALSCARRKATPSSRSRIAGMRSASLKC
jgi:transposase